MLVDSVHFMSGGGGGLAGMEAAGCSPIWFANHLEGAVETIRRNRPHITGEVEDVERLAMRSVPKATVLEGAPICTEVSPSGGRATNSQRATPWDATRATAWSLLRYAEIHRPAVVTGENVLDFARWELFNAWIFAFEELGYHPYLVPLNAAHICGPGYPPVPQNRERLIFAFARKGIDLSVDVRPPAECEQHGAVSGVRRWKPSRHRKTVAGWPLGKYGSYYYRCPQMGCGLRVEPTTSPVLPHVDWSLPTRLVGQGRHEHVFTPYAPATRSKIAHGLACFDGEPFLVICRRNKLTESLHGPVATVTAGGNHHMVVIPGPDGTIDGCRVRMFRTGEKAALQGFASDWQFVTAISPADRLKGVRDMGGVLTGNATPVNVARWIGERIMYALAA